MEARTDGEVMAASAADPAAFATIFDRHAGTVHRYLVRRVGRDDAEALLGDVFRIAFERRATFDPGHAHARPWLYGIATNLVARHRRRLARQHHALGRLARHEPAAPADATAAVDDATDAARALPAVRERLRALPPGERDALLLHAWEGLAYDEVAAALAIPVGTVRSRLNRARRRLRELPPRPGQQPVHPDVFRRRKDDLMTTITGEPGRLEHRSRMYPRLAYRDEHAALAYLTRVFGFTELRAARVEGNGADEPMLAWLEFGEGLVMIGRTNADVHHVISPADLGGTSTVIHVEVDDVDAHYARSRAEGATITMEIEDTWYRARRYEAVDLEGHQWHFNETHDHVRARGGDVPDADTDGGTDG